MLEANELDQVYSQNKRLNLIICFLIENEETSIKDVSEELGLSYNTVLSSMTSVETILKDYKLSLDRKKGAGVFLRGEELEKRILLTAILYSEIADEEFFMQLHSKNKNSANAFIKFLDFEFISKFYLHNKDLVIFHIYTDSSIKKLLITLSIVVNRSDKKIINVDKNSTNSNVTILLERLSAFLKKDITYSAKGYVEKIIKTCRPIEQLSQFDDKYSYSLIYKINTLISNVGKRMNIDFTSDPTLIKGLTTHIEAAIMRYNLKIVEDNEELKEFVLDKYNDLYLVIREELLEVFSDINFNLTELSYIVIHFASSYEQIYRNSFVRCIVICSSGIGSSKILGSLIRKNIPEITNLEYGTPTNLPSGINEKYDIVVSTIELDKGIDYILCPTILQEKDIEKIKTRLGSIAKNKKILVKDNVSNDYSEKIATVSNIMDNIKILKYSDANYHIKEILNYSLTLYSKNKNINLDVDNIIDLLIARHHQSSIVIPEKGLALFHILKDDFEYPIIIITLLKDSILMENAISEEEDVNIFFTMISPDDNKYTDFLSQISIAILNDKVLKNSLVSKNEDFILTKIELILKDNIIIN